MMTGAYVQTVGRMAYVWGWPLVNMANRFYTFSKQPPAPTGTFSLNMRAYWPDKTILDGTWLPPKIQSAT